MARYLDRLPAETADALQGRLHELLTDAYAAAAISTLHCFLAVENDQPATHPRRAACPSPSTPRRGWRPTADPPARPGRPADAGPRPRPPGATQHRSCTSWPPRRATRSRPTATPAPPGLRAGPRVSRRTVRADRWIPANSPSNRATLLVRHLGRQHRGHLRRPDTGSGVGGHAPQLDTGTNRRPHERHSTCHAARRTFPARVRAVRPPRWPRKRCCGTTPERDRRDTCGWRVTTAIGPGGHPSPHRQRLRANPRRPDGGGSPFGSPWAFCRISGEATAP